MASRRRRFAKKAALGIKTWGCQFFTGPHAGPDPRQRSWTFGILRAFSSFNAMTHSNELYCHDMKVPQV